MKESSPTEWDEFFSETGQSIELPADDPLGEIFTEDVWHLENAKPFQFKTSKAVQADWYISSVNGTIKPLPMSDWSSSAATISFTAWLPDRMTQDSIDIWSPTLREAIREACPQIYESKSETILSLDKVCRNYDRLDQYIRDKQLQVSSNDQVLQELKLFTYAFLQSADITKYLGTFGFEKLYENKILSLSHWEDLQQVAFERDLDLLDMAFDAAEEKAIEEKRAKPKEPVKVTAKFFEPSDPWSDSVDVEALANFDWSDRLTAEDKEPREEESREKASDDLNIRASFWGYYDDSIFQEDAPSSKYGWCSICNGRCPLAPRPPPPPTGFRLMTPDEEQRYQLRVSLENAAKVLEAVSNNFDRLAEKYLAENGYSGFKERSVELALRQGDFDTVRFLRSVEFPMREAVSMGDLSLVQRLICYEIDPNDGPHFMERPFQMAIVTGKLDIARYLICRCNITDLGSLRAPLYMALRKGGLEEVRAILNGPRTLTAHDVNGPSATMMQGLRENLRIEHHSFLTASLNPNASLGFRILGDQLKDYRTLWKLGISAMRRLRKDRAPSDFRQVISLLLVASSMRKTTSIEEFGGYDAFLLDLRRWRYLAVEESRRGVFDELVLCLWGQEMHTPDGHLEDFGQDLNFLRAFTREFAEIAKSPPVTDNTAVYEMSGTEQVENNPASNGASDLQQPEAQIIENDPVPIPDIQKESLSCTVGAYLRVGAIFCFFLAGLLVFQGFFMQGNALQSPGQFSSSIGAFYVAPMRVESPSWISFPSFVEEAQSMIQVGEIRTVADLDNFMYHKALSSMPLNEEWDLSLIRKVIETGSVSLKSALKHWTMQKSLNYMAVYHGLQPTLSSLSGCIKSNPTSPIAADLRLLSCSLREVVHYPLGGISTPFSMQTPDTSTSPNVTPGGSREMAQSVSPVQTTIDSEVSVSPPQSWPPGASGHVSRREPLQHLESPSITGPRKHGNRVQKPPGPKDRRTCHKCNLVLSTVTNKNRHMIDKHPESLSQESSPAAGSPLGVTLPTFHFCRFQCGARYTQARNRNSHEKKDCKRRSHA